MMDLNIDYVTGGNREGDHELAFFCGCRALRRSWGDLAHVYTCLDHRPVLRRMTGTGRWVESIFIVEGKPFTPKIGDL